MRYYLGTVATQSRLKQEGLLLVSGSQVVINQKQITKNSQLHNSRQGIMPRGQIRRTS